MNDDDFVSIGEDGEPEEPSPKPPEPPAHGGVDKETGKRLVIGDGSPGTIRKQVGDGTPGPGRTKGVPNRATAEMKEFVDSFLTDAAYRANLKARIMNGEASAIEIRLWEYGYGKPKETIKMEGGDRRPATLVFLENLGDPLAEDEPPPPRRALPRPPVIQEVSFDLDGIDFSDKDEPQ